MKRFCKIFWVILLGFALLLPLLPVRAAGESGRLISVTAKELFSDRSLLVELLIKNDRCYITPEEAARLAGLRYENSTTIGETFRDALGNRWYHLDQRQVTHISH